MISADQSKAVVLVLLDLITAFNEVDHDVPYFRLEKKFGLSGEVLEWFRPHLKKTFQKSSEYCIRYYELVVFCLTWFSS